MKPKLFIGSSIEARKAAHQIADAIRPLYDTQVWTDGFFRPGGSTADTIERRISDFDGAIFVLSPDDLLVSRGLVAPTPRANVLFELGMFGGVLGLPNCTQLVLKAEPSAWKETTIAQLPDLGQEWRAQDRIDQISDLRGITYIELSAKELKTGTHREYELTAASISKVIDEFDRIYTLDSCLLGSVLGAPPRDLGCIWSEGQEEHPADVDACVFRNRLRASYFWPGDEKKYELSIRLEDEQTLWGHWWNSVEVSYGGFAQFQVRARPAYLLGAWLGWSSNGGVKSGRFILARRGVMTDAVKDAKSVELTTSFRRLMRRIGVT